jgi:hypothetical protein
VVFGVANFRGDAQAAACTAAQTTASTAANAYLAKNGGTQVAESQLVTDKYLKAAYTVNGASGWGTSCLKPSELS